MNIMRIQKINRVGENRFEYAYSVEGEWSIYFEASNAMWVEYSKKVSYIPDSIAVLPLIGNVIILASLMNAEIYVDEIDKDFYECTEKFIQGFDNLMPEHVKFKHSDIIHANKIVPNPLSQTLKEENLVFFSGGVDATLSLINHLEEKPALVTIWGADIPWDHEEQWNRAIGFNQAVAEKYELDLLTIRSNFRKSLHDDHVNDYTVKLLNDWWWPAFHHSIAMMGLTAPLAGGTRSKLYIGSSYSSKDKKEWGEYILASDPQIDNYVRFCGCQVVHDGYEFSRYDKIERICKFYKEEKEKPFLRVCYHADTGANCGVCEKCSLSIMAILLAGGNPREYGFYYQEEEFSANFARAVQEKIKNKRKYSFMSQYRDVQKAYREKYSLEETPEVLKTFYQTELDALYDFINAAGFESVKKETIVIEDPGISKELEKVLAEKQELCNRVTALENSTSWKITKPIRRLGKAMKLINNKQEIKNKIYETGMKQLRKKFPDGGWKYDYIKWRWWFICSDQYETRFKPMFHKMLHEYEGKLFNRGKLIKFDYWLCWIFLGAEPDNYFDFEFFRKGWSWRNHHITKQRLNFFVPLFNGSESKLVLNDKKKFNSNWKDYIKRKWCIPQETTFEEFQKLFCDINKIIIKPLALFGGKGIRIFEIEESNIKEIYEQLHNTEEDIIAEEYVYQKGYLHDVYPMALNPLRVCTIRVGEKVEVCYGFFTTGSQGSLISNDCSGGISFSIDVESGKMGNGQGMKSSGHQKHPDTNVLVAGNYVPDWSRIKEFACEAHLLAPADIHLIGWDVCWNAGELSLIEGNNGPGFPELPNKKENQWEKIQEYLDYLDQNN